MAQLKWHVFDVAFPDSRGQNSYFTGCETVMLDKFLSSGYLSFPIWEMEILLPN